MAAETDLQFDGWTVNRVSGEILREGRGARLPQQQLRVLIELFDHAGEIVTRDQLVKALWPAGIVDFDNGLNVAMRKLRVALDDVGDAPRYIETLPRVGYRFIGKCNAQPAIPPAKAARPGTGMALKLGLAALIGAVVLGWWIGVERPGAANKDHRHVPSVRARELYLEGLSLRSRRDIDTSQLAVDKFEASLREDPNYSQAWAALADITSANVVRQKLLPAEGVPKARAAAERAIELEDDLVEGHYALGVILLNHDKDFAGAKREFDRAMAINDRAARLWHHYGMWHGQVGHVEDALAALRRARELEPMTLLYAGNYALLLYEARRYDEAITFLRPYVDANPHFDQARSTLALSMMAVGDLDGAMAQLQARTLLGFNQADLGLLYAKKGLRDDAMKEVERLQLRDQEGYGAAYDQALIYTALGELDLACEKLSRAVTEQAVLVNWMRLDPPLDPLRGRQCYTDADHRLYGEVR